MLIIIKYRINYYFISTLEGSSIFKMTFLDELQLANNNLKNLDKVLDLLSHCHFLTYLSIFYNLLL